MKTKLKVTRKKPALKSISAGTVKLIQLKIRLSYANPPIWRRLLVRSDISLGLLHAVFQVAMGWTNSHLHHFIIGKTRYADLRMNEGSFMDEDPDLDEWKISLETALAGGADHFLYEYDFGDSWIHLIEIEKTLDSHERSVAVAQCIEGKRACPPEDCGGLPGYENLLVVLADPENEEHESMKEWIGHPLNPEAFDLKRINSFLRKVKGPRITDAQLGRVLMDRDGYKE